MKRLNLHFKIILLISALFISSKNIYSQWSIVGDLAGLSPRPTVSVVDRNTAFVTGGDSVNVTYKTTNGGRNWIQLNTGSFGIFWSIWAIDANTVFAGANGVTGSGSKIKLYRSKNGGMNWTVIDSNSADIPSVTGIKFSNSMPSFGIAVTGAPNSDFYIYKTRDEGDTWTRTQVTGYSGINSGLGSLNVIDSLFYALGTIGTSSSIIITTDGGVTWNLRDLGLPVSSFSTTGIAFKEDKLTGIAGSVLPIIARTTNGGLNWENVDVGNNVTGVAVRMRWIEGTNTCYINATDIPNGGILKSTNGGLNWTKMSTSGVGIYNFDTKIIGSNVYGYAISSIAVFVGGNQVLKVSDALTGINQGIAAPSNLNAQSIDSSFIKLDWQDNSNDEDGFYIERTKTNDSTHWEVIDVVSQNVNQYSDFFVTRGLKYFYRVKAYLGNTYSEYSNIDSAILGGNPSLIPAPPSKLVLVTRTANAITMDWHDNSNNENGFIIFRKAEGDLFFEIADSVSTDVVTYQEVGLAPNVNYYYKVCSFNSSGISDFSNTLIVIAKSPPFIETFEPEGDDILSGNYPNPFNPKTIINYQLSIINFVSLKVYDVLGNEVATLVNEKQNAGTYSVDFDGSNLASGVYFYKLQAGEFTETKKMTLIK